MNRKIFLTRSLSFALLLGLSVSLPAQAPAAPEAQKGTAKTVRLLTIGNSFSGNATRFLGKIAQAGGHILIHRSVSVGGASLELHAGKMRAHENDPQDKAGRYANGRSLREELTAERWEFVTIQQASIKSHDLATYQPFAGQLRDFIRQHAPQAKLLVHQTWAYRIDDPRFTIPSQKPGEPQTQEAMYRGLSAAYAAIRKDLGATRLPVGDAFFLADSDPQWGFQSDPKFDPKGASQPALPNQTHSLHIGWQWKKQKDGAQKLVMDGHHANTAGEYLGACVWYEVLFGERVVDNPFSPPGIEPEYARFLRSTAHRAVQASTALTE